jgi:hypothetical protein
VGAKQTLLLLLLRTTPSLTPRRSPMCLISVIALLGLL